MYDLYSLLQAELVQRREEGCNVGQFEAPVAELDERAQPAEINALYDELMELEPQSDFPYVEPSELDAIRYERPDGPRRLLLDLSEDELADRLLGAWLGRCAGCQLGKPVEGWPRQQIQDYLELAGEWPLDNYFPALDPMPEGFELHRSWRDAVRGRIRFMARDDDIDYTILGTYILETYGLDFATGDVGETWLYRLPYWQVYTAERAAYRNLVNSLPLTQVPIHRNPYREWIGAQIRADGFGYAGVGLPERAAEFAYRDAALSHVKNGIYGEMWVAAMLAAAFAAEDTRRADLVNVIEIGLSEIPKNSRLAEAVRQTMTWCDEYPHWEDTWEEVNATFGHYHRVHTINNAALVVMGLLYGEGNLERTITVAVMGGWDTDCNGATAGSVVGAMTGARALPGKWVAPLDDRIRSYVIGYDNSRISDLARRSLALSKQTQTYFGVGD